MPHQQSSVIYEEGIGMVCLYLSASVEDEKDDEEEDYDDCDAAYDYQHPHAQFGLCVQQKHTVIKQYTVQRTHHVNPSFCCKKDCGHKVMPMSYFLLSSHFLRSPIFSVITVDVSTALFCNSSHFHFPLSPVPTSGMVRVVG